MRGLRRCAQPHALGSPMSDRARPDQEGNQAHSRGPRVVDLADILAHLGTLARNTVTTSLHKGHSFTLHTRPTAIQETAFKLLDIDPTRIQ